VHTAANHRASLFNLSAVKMSRPPVFLHDHEFLNPTPTREIRLEIQDPNVTSQTRHVPAVMRRHAEGKIKGLLSCTAYTSHKNGIPQAYS
jgi:hypothetical protein